MPVDLKLSQIGSSPLLPPFRGPHSPGVRKHYQIIFACYFRISSIRRDVSLSSADLVYLPLSSVLCVFANFELYLDGVLFVIKKKVVHFQGQCQGCCCFWLMIAHIALFSALLSRLTALACGFTWVTSFIVHFFNIHRSGVLTALAWLVPHDTALAVSTQVLCKFFVHPVTSCNATYVRCMRV